MTTLGQQRVLQLRLDDRIALLDVSAARAAYGCGSEEVSERIESGLVRWAFDISTGRGEVRELRIWRTCLTDPDQAGNATLDQVIREVIGGNAAEPMVRAARIETRWMVSTQTIRRLRKGGDITAELIGHTLWITRASLIALLQRRHVK